MPLHVNWPFPSSPRIPFWWPALSKVTIAAVGVSSKIWLEWMNRTTVHHRDRLYQHAEKRPKGRPLITVANHVSCLDDPLLWGLLKVRYLTKNNDFMRWSLGASDICFINNPVAKFFALGQTIPVVRGDGVYQRGMDYALEALDRGGWVHIFPEGKVNMTNEFLRLKWGVGRLIADCKRNPIILPLWHIGLEKVLPNYSPYIPRIGKRVTVLIGEPMDLGNVMEKLREIKASPVVMRKKLTDIIQDELLILKDMAETLHNQQPES